MLRHARAFMLGKGFWTERTVPLADVEAALGLMRPVDASIPLRRLGGAVGGGYLVPDDLDGIAACISPGTYTECHFDAALADLGIPVFIADARVDGPPAPHPLFHFTRRSFDTYADDMRVTFDGFCAAVAPAEGDLILDMDIEGAEYRVLASVSDALLSRFRIMTIEFHHLGNLHTPLGLEEIGAVFRRLSRTHAIVHVHPNNAVPPVECGGIAIPPVMEFTFLRRDRARFTPAAGPYPHPLDVRVEDHLPDFALPACWYGQGAAR
jgi:hypothetical protein